MIFFQTFNNYVQKGPTAGPLTTIEEAVCLAILSIGAVCSDEEAKNLLLR